MLAIKTYTQDTINSPFGMVMPGRNWTAASSNGYGFGFNGQMQDDEIYSNRNLNSAMFWEYDTRSGRRWNIDPKPNISLSLYSTFSSNPILYNDIFGDTIKVKPASQSFYIEDLSAILGMDASICFEFDECNVLSLTKAGEVRYRIETELQSNKVALYKGVIDLINNAEVTEMVYTDGPILNPETGTVYTDDKGQTLSGAAGDVRSYGGEATMTVTDIVSQNIQNATQNTVTILKDKIHSPGKFNDPRENNTFHGMGHVLYQNKSQQESVIDFDNKSRLENNAPKRPIDQSHKNQLD